MKRQPRQINRQRRSATRHGLQHVADLLPKIIGEIEAAWEETAENESAGEQVPVSLTMPSPSDSAQNTFAFYQPADLG